MKKNMEAITLSSPKIKCDGCRKTITKTLRWTRGVKVINVDIPNKEVSLEYDPNKISTNKILEKLANVNYPSKIINK